MRRLAKAFLKTLGWKVIPLNQKIDKAVIIVAPHTSTWDLFIALAISLNIDANIRWVGKKEIFAFPFGPILKKLGGIALDREHCHNTVSAIVKEFKKNKEFLFAISPEGTRASGKYWRSGFYYIAIKAEVPIVLAFLDYEKREGGFGKIIYPTGKVQEDLEEIKKFYDTIHAKHPKKFAPIRFKEKLELQEG